MVCQQRAVEVVDLMLDAYRLEVLCFQLDFLLVDRPAPDQDALGSLHLGGKVDDAQAPFLVGDGSGLLRDYRVDDLDEVPTAILGRCVDNDRAFENTDLRSREADPRATYMVSTMLLSIPATRPLISLTSFASRVSTGSGNLRTSRTGTGPVNAKTSRSARF